MKEGKSKRLVLTRDYLVRATYNYLQRFATTEKNLRAVLGRKARRRLSDDDGSDSSDLMSQVNIWIDDIVHKAVEQNLVNDRQFAEARARSLIRSGNSKMKIGQKLQAKGVAADVVADVLETLAEQYEDMDVMAAVKYARKRRFGAFSIRHDGEDLPENKLVEKELASMCRAGFSFGLASRVLKMSHPDLEDIFYRTSL